MNAKRIYRNLFRPATLSEGFLDSSAFCFGLSPFTCFVLEANAYRPLFFYDHLQRLYQSLVYLYGDISETNLKAALEQQLKEMTSSEKTYCRITFFKQEDDLYHVISKRSFVESSFEFPLALSFAPQPLSLPPYPPFLKIGGRYSWTYPFFEGASPFPQREEILLYDHQHFLLEGIRHNLILKKGDYFFIPERSRGVLEGIVQKNLIEKLGRNRCREEKIHKDSLDDFDEIYLTNSLCLVRATILDKKTKSCPSTLVFLRKLLVDSVGH